LHLHGLLVLHLHLHLWIDYLLEAGGGAVEASNLIENVPSIVVWHLHASVVVIQSRIAHLQRLHRDRRNTTEVGLITLALQDCLLSELNAVLFFKFADHSLEEL
jgi:hypothetical protein